MSCILLISLLHVYMSYMSCVHCESCGSHVVFVNVALCLECAVSCPLLIQGVPYVANGLFWRKHVLYARISETTSLCPLHDTRPSYLID